MNLASFGRRTEQILNRYEAFLSKLSEENFQQNPAPGVWSYSEVYSHIATSNQACFMAMENCIKGTANESSKRIHPIAWLILFTGRFPPVKIKAPSRIAAMVQRLTKDEARLEIQQLKERLSNILPKIYGASLTQKVPHPRLGLLNARQWLRFIEIHTLHHEKQLYRIEKGLRLS